MAKIDFLAFMKTHTGRVVISIAWGLALALVFKKTCENGRCTVVVGPSLDAVRGRTYEFAGHGCYTFTPRLVQCAKAETRYVSVVAPKQFDIDRPPPNAPRQDSLGQNVRPL